MCPTEDSVQNDIKKISELITLYTDRLGLSTRSKVLDIYASWAAIVGEKQAAHSKLIDIKHQTALIETDHPGWSQQILLNKKRIIWNFKKKYPQLDVKDISVMVSPHQTEERHSSATSLTSKYKNEQSIVHAESIQRQNKEKESLSVSHKQPQQNMPVELQSLLERLGKTIAENERHGKKV